jgi:hypothetical protein
MKRLGIITLLLMFALLCGTAAAETANKDLPSKAEIMSFLSENSEKSPMELAQAAYLKDSTWKWDLLEGGNDIGFFWSIPNSQGYGSQYVGKDADRINKCKTCLKDYSMFESYKGEGITIYGKVGSETKKEITSTQKEETQTASQESDSVSSSSILTVGGNEPTSKHTLSDLYTDMGAYKGNTRCITKKCADDYRDYFIQKGWNARTLYAVEVQVEGNGEDNVRYLVLN